MKQCPKCKKQKAEIRFSKDKSRKSGLMPWCKDCCKKYAVQYRLNNATKEKERHKKYYTENKEKERIYHQEYYQLNRRKENERTRKWRIVNRAKHLKHVKHSNEKVSLNPQKRLVRNITGAIWHSIKENKAGRRWEGLVGYTLANLIKHLEGQFEDGMSWDNYGKTGWEIDHIIPISKFNFTEAEHLDFKRCWALKNLQPMWQRENIRKRDKIQRPFQPYLELRAITL